MTDPIRRPLRSPALLAVVLLSVAATGAAQGPVSPAHYELEEGFTISGYPFTSTARYQQVHRDRIGSPLAIGALSFRRDGRSTGVIQPRALTLTVTLADAQATTSADFQSNYAGPGQVVFQGQVNTPSQWSTAPRQSPAPFELSVPFAAPWQYAGSSAFLWETAVSSNNGTGTVTADRATAGFHLFTYGPYYMNGTGCTTPNGVMEMRANVQNQSFPPGINYHWPTTGAPANAAAALLIGLLPTNVLLPGACGPILVQSFASIAGQTTASGALDFAFRQPDHPVLHATWFVTQTLALDPSQAGIPVAASNGVVSRAQVLAPPSFAIDGVGATSHLATQGTLSAGAAIVVRFD